MMKCRVQPPLKTQPSSHCYGDSSSGGLDSLNVFYFVISVLTLYIFKEDSQDMTFELLSLLVFPYLRLLVSPSVMT